MQQKSNLIHELPEVRGEYKENVDLSKMTWFGVGGKADILFEPADIEDLSFFLKNKDRNIPFVVLGGGANVLIRDRGIRGVVIHLRMFNNIKKKEDFVEVEAGCMNNNLFKFCKEHGIKGFEFLGTVPGTIGGAIRMNAGCYGQYVSDIILSVKIVDSLGNIQEVKKEKMGLEYRKNNMPEDIIFVEATFKAEKGNKEEIDSKFKEYVNNRIERHPQGVKTAGSTFKNPAEGPAWKFIDEAGCRGLTLGGAQMSEKHSNFMINTGKATARDLEDLGELVRRKVKEKTGILLEWEVQMMGEY